jgi:hypothetical protein
MSGDIPKYRMTTPQMVAVLRFHMNASRTPGNPEKATIPTRLLQVAAERLERLDQRPEPHPRSLRAHVWARSSRYAVEICSACGIPKRKGGRNFGCDGRPQGVKSAERVAIVNGGFEQ